jgi:hypothetical protein
MSTEVEQGSYVASIPFDALDTLRKAGLVPGQVVYIVGRDATDPQSYLVKSDAWQRQRSRFVERTQRLTDARQMIRSLFDTPSDSGHPWFDEITLTLDQANELLVLLMDEPMKQTREYEITVTVTYEITATVECADEEQARQAAEELMGEVGEPDVSEPNVDGVNWIDSATVSLTDESFEVSEV